MLEQNLPALDNDYRLASGLVAAYQKNGHILLRGVAGADEVAAYRRPIADFVRRHNSQNKPLEERDTYGKAFIQIGNLWHKDELCRRFVFAKRFAKIAADLMGVEGVRLYHDQALFKEPGGGHTPWHQDQFYWPLDTDKTITMWMPLVDAAPEMGTMTFASGTQRLGYFGDLAISDESESTYNAYLAEHGIPVVQCGAMAAGDATFHAGWTLHSAPGNHSGRMREVMTIIYIADGLTIAEPKNDNQRADQEAFFPGLKPGDLAASEMNPLLFDRIIDQGSFNTTSINTSFIRIVRDN